jgi:hypothetical protein
MLVDVHITTCNHFDVKCRPRFNDRGVQGFNIKGWTQLDRVSISKYSVDSICRFVKSMSPDSLSRFSLLDDGSNIPEAENWLTSLDEKTLLVKRYQHRGSSYGINDYYKSMACDLVAHFEDDHVMFNPFNLNWAEICYNILTSPKAKEHNIKVLTFRSCLPTRNNDPGLHGAWGARGMQKINNLPTLTIHEAMGNAHHIMLKETYDQFMPLSGNTGGCEAQMNNSLSSMGFKNAEIQMPVYAFHSHTWNQPLPLKVTSEDLCKSAIGVEYGIKNMHEFFLEKKPIIVDYIEDWPDYYKSINCLNYHY